MFVFRSFSEWLRGRGRPVSVVRKPPRPRLGLEALDDRTLPSVTASFSAGVLTVAGDTLDNTIVVSRDAAGTILVNNGAVAIQGGQATVANTSKVLVTGGAGNDVLTADETNGGLPQTTLDGGAGNDVLTGGVADVPGLISGFDTFLGGAGDDRISGGASADFINGGTGNDTLFGGAGDDRYSWNPGDGSDTMDGQAGNDSIGFFGDGSNENFTLSANGTRVRLTRDVDAVTADLNSLEIVDVLTKGGADTITVNDLTGTGVGVMLFDLGDAGTGGDGQADNVIVNGTSGNDRVFITGSTIGGASLDMVGLSSQISIFSTETIDHLMVNTLGGFDRVDSSGLGAGVIGLTTDLGDGQDAGVATTTTLRTSAATTVFGQSVTLTANVSSAAGIPPGGFFTFRAGDSVLGTALVDSSGQATFTTFLNVGNTSLTATYTGTGNFANSTSAAVPLTVTRAATAVALAPSVNTVAAGQSVTFTATISVLAPGMGSPGGTVTFMEGNTVLGTAQVSPLSGTARFTTSFATAGGHVITAVYSGDANFAASSQTFTEQVTAPATRSATTTTLAPSVSTAAVGQAVTFTATVRGPAGSPIPTGTVTFLVNGRAVARVTLDANGQARLTGSFASTGLFNVQVVYSGDANFAASSRSIFERVI